VVSMVGIAVGELPRAVVKVFTMLGERGEVDVEDVSRGRSDVLIVEVGEDIIDIACRGATRLALMADVVLS
jgi:hypothetical protein